MLGKFLVLSFALLLGSASAQVNGVDYTLSTNPNDVHFYLYTSSSEKQEIVFNDPISLVNSQFQPNSKTVFIIHGFRSNMTSEMPQSLKDAYLVAGLYKNHIVVDWGLLSIALPPSVTSAMYKPVVANVPIVARRVADFIAFLIYNFEIEPSNIRLIGHSLGSHISGLVGLHIQEQFPGTLIDRITGLDPAGPEYGLGFQNRKLAETDAAFVDVIHSNMGVLGDSSEDGHADFYPNGGASQPGCTLDDTGIPAGDVTYIGRCSHRFAYKILIASLQKNFTACQCNPFLVFCYGFCSVKVRAGEYCPRTARGQFYFTTSSTP